MELSWCERTKTASPARKRDGERGRWRMMHTLVRVQAKRAATEREIANNRHREGKKESTYILHLRVFFDFFHVTVIDEMGKMKT